MGSSIQQGRDFSPSAGRRYSDLCSQRRAGHCCLPLYVPEKGLLTHVSPVPKGRARWRVAGSDLFSSFPSAVSRDITEYGFWR